MPKKITYKTIYNLNFENKSKEEIEDIIANAIIKANNKIETPTIREKNKEKNNNMFKFLFKQKQLISDVDGIDFCTNTILYGFLTTLKFILTVFIICLILASVPWIYKFICGEITNIELFVGISTLFSLAMIVTLFQRLVSYIKLSIEKFDYNSGKILNFLTIIIALLSLIISILTNILSK